MLRQAREAKGLSLQAVSSATKIREPILAALESEAYDDLPAPVFVRGFLRTLARCLNLDAEQLVALYCEAMAPNPAEQPTTDVVALESARPAHALGRPAWLSANALLSVLIALLLIAGVAWGGGQVLRELGQTLPTKAVEQVSPTSPPIFLEPTPTQAFALNPTSVASTETPTAVPAIFASPTPLPAPPNFEVRVELTERSWLRVEADGTEAYQGILEVGNSKVFSARNRITMRAGNGGGVNAFINGQPQGALGATGAVVDKQWVLNENGAIASTAPTWTNPPTAPTPTPQK